ncbi:hypothetical protein D915_003323 [Fasciola hepatica]|uniref:SH2 domain-containing protein n=1 Tax=Fasciola hepatica TaxID=6192 RepID=A0A4E0RUU5_FASHE|nr:hypothetical protein D915_003323 [Fasciola hepatica]
MLVFVQVTLITSFMEELKSHRQRMIEIVRSVIFCNNRPVSIVRILDDLDDHSSGMSQSSPSPDTNASIDNRSGGCQQKTSIQGVDNVLDNSGDQNKNSLRIKPWPQIDSNETSDVENVENTGTITMPTSSKKPSEFSYVREISISDGSTPEMQRREPQPIIPTKNVSHDSRSLIVLERPSECNHDPPESTIRGSVISKPPYMNNSYSNGNQNESASHRTIYVNGINKSFVTLSTDDMMGDSDSSESDIQPSSLQRFPRLSIEDRNSASFFRIRELPSPQSTPSLPRRVLSSQTLHLKQPAQRDTNTHVVLTFLVVFKVALKHRVAPEILRRTEQLYRYVSQPSPPTLTTNPVTSSVGNSVVQATTPLIPILTSNSATKITDTTANTTMRPGGSWFRRSEAANLMRDFSLPATGFDTARPDQTFSRVPRWFHGTIDRSRAEQLLRQVDLDGAFLVRVDPLAQRYVISVLWAGQVSHILVSVITPEPHLNALGPSYQLYGLTNVDQFSSLRELVQYYATLEALRHTDGGLRSTTPPVSVTTTKYKIHKLTSIDGHSINVARPGGDRSVYLGAGNSCSRAVFRGGRRLHR